jgi:hypothetical protein
MYYSGIITPIMLYFNWLLCKRFYNIYGGYVLYVANRWQWFTFHFYWLPEDGAILRLLISIFQICYFSKTWNTSTLVLSTGITKHTPLRINSGRQCLCYFFECLWSMSWRENERMRILILQFEVMCSIPQIICSKRTKYRNLPVLTQYTKHECSLENSVFHKLNNNLRQC